MTIIQENHSLKHLNTFGIDVSARYFATARSVQELEFLGSFGVLVKDDKKRLSQRGYEWASEFNGQKFITEIGANMHGDLEISRKDITAYETIDPFENKVSYRPELNSDFQLVIGASSVESSVLAILLNYAEHEKVKSEVLEDNGKKFLKEIIEQHGETLRPYLGDYSPSLYFTSFKLINLCDVRWI